MRQLLCASKSDPVMLLRELDAEFSNSMQLLRTSCVPYCISYLITQLLYVNDRVDRFDAKTMQQKLELTLYIRLIDHDLGAADPLKLVRWLRSFGSCTVMIGEQAMSSVEPLRQLAAANNIEIKPLAKPAVGKAQLIICEAKGEQHTVMAQRCEQGWVLRDSGMCGRIFYYSSYESLMASITNFTGIALNVCFDLESAYTYTQNAVGLADKELQQLPERIKDIRHAFDSVLMFSRFCHQVSEWSKSLQIQAVKSFIDAHVGRLTSISMNRVFCSLMMARRSSGPGFAVNRLASQLRFLPAYDYGLKDVKSIIGLLSCVDVDRFLLNSFIDKLCTAKMLEGLIGSIDHLIELRRAFGDQRYASFKRLLDNYHDMVGIDRLQPSLHSLCDLFCIATYAPCGDVSFHSAMSLFKHIGDYHPKLLPVCVGVLEAHWIERLSSDQRDELCQAIGRHMPDFSLTGVSSVRP